MSTDELAHQPAVAVEIEYMEASSDDAIPETKSGVGIDPSAALKEPTPRFSKNDTVHASLVIGSDRIRGTYQVYQSNYNRQRGFFEYRLIEPLTRTLFKNGVWIRERDLRMDKRG